jgi:hypothetical protein
MKQLILAVCIALVNSGIAQVENNEDNDILKNDKEDIFLYYDGQTYSPKYFIRKNDNNGKQIYVTNLLVPDKGQDMILPNDKISTMLVGTDIQIIYDVYNGKENLKQCFIKTLPIKGSPLSEAKLLHQTPCKSKFSIGNTNYRVIYSPDKTKFALLLDNYSKGIVIEEPTIIIFDSKKLTALSTKKLKSMYNGAKAQIDPYTNFNMDNLGNIKLNFGSMSEKTNIAIKTFQGDIPFAENDIKNIKEVGDAPTSDANSEASKSEQGRFYKTIEDYVNKKPSNEVKIKNGSYVWGTLGGERLKVIDKNGNIETEKISNFSGMFFTYRGEYSTSFDLYMAVDGGAYSVLRAGKISLYTHREATGNGGEKDVLYYSNSETKGEVKNFKEKNLEDWLESANLLEAYNKEKPKREFKDDKSDYYTKEVSRYLKYIDILNKK